MILGLPQRTAIAAGNAWATRKSRTLRIYGLASLARKCSVGDEAFKSSLMGIMVDVGVKEVEARDLMQHVGGLACTQKPELSAQIMLAVRKLEEAQFRLRRAREVAGITEAA